MPPPRPKMPPPRPKMPSPRPKMPSHDPLDDGPIMYAFKHFEDYDEAFVDVIRESFADWGKQLMDDPAPLTDKELEEHTDRLVFSNWDTDTVPPVPSFKAPKLTETRVQIGWIDKDLPDSIEGRRKWKNGLEHEIPDIKPGSPVPDVRKAGQPAFVRARPELLEQLLVVPFEFVDRSGDWVPKSHIDFTASLDDTPSDILLAAACKRAETAWARACDDWNADLCIFHCRDALYDMTHYGVPCLDRDRVLPRSLFDSSQHRLVPKICSSIHTVLGRIQRIALVTGVQEIYNGRGRAVFKPRAAEESTVGEPENHQ